MTVLVLTGEEVDELVDLLQIQIDALQYVPFTSDEEESRNQARMQLLKGMVGKLRMNGEDI